MFELVGLAIATIMLLAVAAVVATAISLSAWFFLRGKMHRKKLTIIAIMLPFATAAYWWLLTATFPGVSLFGDIEQPLPHHFVLTALGEMPDYGHINPPSGNPKAAVPAHSIDRVDLQGDLLCGRFNTHTSEAVVDSFFIFDTQRDRVESFRDLETLEASLGHRTNMVSLPEFLSPAGRTQRHLYFWTAGLPPLTVMIIWLFCLFRARQKPTSTA